MYKIFLFSILAISSATASAVTMEQALISGYKHNEDLKILQNNFLDEIEAFPRALAGFMPKISAAITSADLKHKTTASTKDINTYNRTLSLEQPLFDGWSSVSELKSAQFAFYASRGRYYAKEQEVFLKEINAYLGCVESKEKYEISKISVKSNKTQLDAWTEKFKLGEATATEVASAREGLATAEANQAVSYANDESSKANFYQIFGVEAINIQMPTAPSDLPCSLAILIERAIAVNPSIDSANYTRKLEKAKECATKGKLLPSASFKLENGRTKYDEGGRVLAGKENNRSTTATISLTVPILARGGMEYSDVRRSKYKTKEAVIGFDSAMKQIKANCQAKWAELEASRARIQATEQAVKAAEIAYDGMIQEEMLGSKTIIDILRAEERLNKAREGRIEAHKAIILAIYQIKALEGELTAKAMKLKVDHFNPEREFKKKKMKIIGF